MHAIQSTPCRASTRGTALKERLLAANRETLGRLFAAAELPPEHESMLRRTVEWLASYMLPVPASKRHHHPEEGGLLAHTLEVTAMVAAEAAKPFASHELKADLVYLALLWALFHDVGKRRFADVRCERCGTSADADQDLEAFYNTHDAPVCRYVTTPEGRHTLASRFFFWDWLREPKLPMPEAARKLALAHYHGVERRSEMGVVERVVQRLNGKANCEYRGAIEEKDVWPLLKDCAVPTSFPIRPSMHVAVAATLHHLVREKLTQVNAPGAAVYVLADYIALDFLAVHESLQLVASTLFGREIPELTFYDASPWKLGYALRSEGAILVPNKHRLLFNATIRFPDGTETSTEILLLNRRLGEVLILDSVPTFTGSITLVDHGRTFGPENERETNSGKTTTNRDDDSSRSGADA